MFDVVKSILILISLLIGVFSSAFSQRDGNIYFAKFTGLRAEFLPQKNKYDSIGLVEKAGDILTQLRNNGYWFASIDSTLFDADSSRVYFYTGRKYDHVQIQISEEGKLTTDYRHSYADWSNVQSLQQVSEQIEKTLSYYELNGYPFISIEIDSTRLENDILFIAIKLDLGSKITYDSLEISPQGIIKTTFLSKYLGMEYGENYDEKNFRALNKKIENLSFVELKQATTTFQLKQAKIDIDLAPRKVNFFDGILGIRSSADGEGAQFTGELNLSLKNLFKSAKELDVRWVKLKPESQELHVSYLHPILFGSPLGFYFSFDQIKQDTTFSNRSLELAFEYRPRHNLKMKINYGNVLGNRLNENESSSGNFKIGYYGISALWYKLDDFHQPKNGFQFHVKASVGQKEIQDKALELPNSTQYRLSTNLDIYKQISRSVLYFKSQNGIILNDYLYLNDLFRLGGLNTIRGFDEQDFYASKYAMVNLEWRYYLDANSFLLTFYDQSFMSYRIISSDFLDNPSGLGLGLQYATNSGNFKILYGLGRRSGEGFSFNSSKIHFGYTAIF